MQGSVMVIDDNQSILKIVGYWLEKAGYEVCVSKRPVEGLQLIREGAFDLLILDLRMRELGGLELLRNLKVDEAFGNLPVILITGQSAIRNIDYEERELFDAFLTKPFERDEFLGCVRETIAVRGAAQGGE